VEITERLKWLAALVALVGHFTIPVADIAHDIPPDLGLRAGRMVFNRPLLVVAVAVAGGAWLHSCPPFMELNTSTGSEMPRRAQNAAAPICTSTNDAHAQRGRDWNERGATTRSYLRSLVELIAH